MSKNNGEITTKPIWILLFLELGLIGLRFVIPYLFQVLISHDGTHLLDNPIYLNNVKTLGTFENLHAPTDTDTVILNLAIIIRYQPGFTLIHNHQILRPSYTRYTNILNYGR